MKLYLLIILLTFCIQFDISAQVGSIAPNFTVTDVHGKQHRLYEDYLDKGKKVLIDFFFTTCGPCIYYAPQVNKAYEKYGCNTQDVVFITIDYNDTDAEVIAYDQTHNIQFPSFSGLNGGGNAVCSQYRISAFPTFLLIDSSRKILLNDIDPPTVVVFDHLFAMHNLTPKACITSTQTENEVAAHLFPNPSNGGELYITSESFNNGDTKIELYDVSGNLVQHTMFVAANNVISVNIESLPTGCYVAKVLIGQDNIIRKSFVKL